MQTFLKGWGFVACLLISLLSYLPPLCGQGNIKFDRITTEDGLPQEHVYAVLEDKKGFLWLGMESGLARYDGYSFVTYSHDPEDSTSIGGNFVRTIFEDSLGFLWVGTDGGGVSRYSPEKDNFINYRHDPEAPNSLSGNRVYGITADRDGAVWIATLNSGLNRLVLTATEDNTRQPEATFTRFRHQTEDPGSLADDNIWTLFVDRQNRLWVGTVSAGLDMLDLSKSDSGKPNFIHFRHGLGNPQTLSNNSVKSIYEDRGGTIWVGTEFGGLNRYDSEHGTFRSWTYDQTDPKSLSNNHVSCLLEDKAGTFWVGTNGGGLNAFAVAEGIFDRYEYIPSDPYSLHGNLVSTMYQSKSGILWLGMVNKGLNRIDPKKQLINHFYPVSETPNSLKGNLIKAIYEDRAGDIWVGAYGEGLSHFDPATGSFTNYPQPVRGGNIAVNNIQCIYEDSGSRLWIGTDGGGLFLFDRKAKSFTDYNQLANGKKLSGRAVWAIREDLKGNLWVGTADGGLNRLDLARQELQYFRHDANDASSLASNDVRVVFEDHLGILWIGTYGGGLSRFSPQDESFNHYRAEPKKQGSISNDIITDIFESAGSHQLWVGTYGGGLNRFDRVQAAFTTYREADGLANDVVKSIEADQAGNLWISTLQGISKFNPQTLGFLDYTTSDGLQGDGFNLGASFFSSQGVMYFGGTNGMNAFSPDKVDGRSDERFSCHLTDLKMFNRSIRPGEAIGKKVLLAKVIDEVDEITIPYFIDDFTLEFAALDFAASDKLKYAYQLEGRNGGSSWTYTDAEHRYASYSNLSPGNYTFRVRASNAAGIWNTDAKELQLTILPAPWKTVWAYLAYGLLFLLAAYSYRKYTLARFKLKSELKLERLERKKTKELNEMKLQFFTNISHEIRTPLTLIVSPIRELISSGEVRKEVRDQLRNVNRNANRLLLLVNQLLEFRQQEAGHSEMQVHKADITPFVREVVLSFKEFADRRNIHLNLEASSSPTWLWFDEQKMEKVLFNLLSNAFKFSTDGGKISVGIEELQGEVEIRVEDSGRGISPDDLPNIFDRFHKFDTTYQGTYLGSGIGLALTKKLVELHHGTITVKSEVGKFTRFTMRFPQQADHFEEDQLVTGTVEKATEDYYPVEEGAAAGAVKVTIAEDAPQLLIVEDNAEVRNYLLKLFAGTYRLLDAADGKAAWSLAKEHSPDLVLSDVMMPELDGIELCKLIKTSLETSHIPVILLTARNSMFYQTEGLETGADDYLTKPFDPKLLILRVKNLIASRQRMREKFGRQVALEPQEVTLTTPDQEMLQRAIDAVEKHMDNPDFDVSQLAKEVGVSRPVLYRKLPALTDYTPNEFIRIIRLKRAAQILDQADLPVTEVCYSTGFKTPKYFSKCFRDFFGVLPSEYAKERKEERERHTGV